MDDEDLRGMMPINWWLKGTNANIMSAANKVRCLLALQVHRQSKEIAAECTSQSPGASRVSQRSTKEKDKQAERAKARAERQGADYYFRKEKKARLQVVNVAILEKQNDMISKQLTLLTESKDVFVRKFSQQEYDNKVIALLEKLPNPIADMLGDEIDGDSVEHLDDDEN